ncbi:MAG: hypothetical protein GY846_00125, partial [Deltaproteobacteria bacterium]|nr:hypothetical protein [Deltaproteobacteria bacterium]
MKKSLIFSTGILLITLLLSGCGDKKPNVYVSKKNVYTLLYPEGWDMLDDERKLTELRGKVNEQMKGPMKFAMNPDVVFRGGKTLGGLVLINSVPASGKSSEKIMSQYMKLMKGIFGRLSDKSWEKEINGKPFAITIAPAEGGAVTMAAMTSHKNHIYNFQFSCPKAEFETWKPTFEQCFDSISFNNEDVQRAMKSFSGSKAGFLTGLWNGFLSPFRWVISFFTN